jgi:hypothetical protein
MNASPTRPRAARRRLIAWLAFGVLGLSMGAIWASGVATVDATGSGELTEAAPLTEDPTQPAAASRFQGMVAASTGLSVGWTGRWGSISADQSLFFVDLSSKTAAESFWFTMTTGDPQPSGWEALQLLVEVTPVAGSDCSAAAHDATAAGGSGATASKVMYIDTSDPAITFTGLPGGGKYCIGMNAAGGKDAAATFLRRINTGNNSVVYPKFIGILNQES